MGNYYFLAPSLPPLSLGHKPELSSAELFQRLEINLGKEDLEKTKVIRLFIDINNIRTLLLEEPIDVRGNLNEKELDEALLVKSVFPHYVFDFLDKYETSVEHLANFPELLSQFFYEEIPLNEGFLHKYLTFEKEWRLVLTALRAKRGKRNILREMQFENFKDPLVMHILAQKDETEYEPPIEYTDLKEILLATWQDPWEQYKTFANWRFNRIEELVEAPQFSIDWILAYIAKLFIVEQWYQLNEEKGLMILSAFYS